MDVHATTAELNFNISMNGFYDNETALDVGNAVGALIRSLSKHINIESLCGVSIDYDYQGALDAVDRGIETTEALTPSSGDVVGAAMVVRVIRNGVTKCHIVFNAAYIEGIITPIESDDWMTAVAVIAHECAHVSNSAALEKCFPNHLMSYSYKHLHDKFRGECWLTVMEEYCATRISSGMGANQIEMFEGMFFRQAEKLFDTVKEDIFNCKIHRNVVLTLNKTYGEIGTTLSLAAYYFGMCAAQGVDYKQTREFELCDIEWLIPFLERLVVACDVIYRNYGKWESFLEMEVISDIQDDIAVRLGVVISHPPQGERVDFI